MQTRAKHSDPGLRQTQGISLAQASSSHVNIMPKKCHPQMKQE